MKILVTILLCGLAGNSFSQSSKTSIGFALTPSFSSIRYVNEGSSFTEENFQEIEANTRGSLGLSGNFFFQYKLSDKFFVTWGLGGQYYGYKTDVYSQGQVVNELVDRSSKFTQYYLQLMASAKYRFYDNAYVRLGFGVDLLLEARIERSESCETGDYFFRGDDEYSAFSGFLVPASIGLGYELKLTDKWNLLTELNASMAFTNAYENTFFRDFGSEVYRDHLNQKPMNIGFSIGVIRSF